MLPLPKSIHSERLVIRPFNEKDRDGYLAFMTDPESTRYLLFDDEQRTEAGADALLDAVINSYSSNEPIFAYAIALKSDDRFIGSCGVSPLVKAGHVECYYSLLRSFCGSGYATEATTALLHYCFETGGVEEVWAFMSPENPKSAGVAERVGMEARGLVEHPASGTAARAFVATRTPATDAPQ